LAILLPSIILLLFTATQICMYYLAREEALAAAQQYITAQRQYGASPTAGMDSYRQYMNNTTQWLTSPVATPGAADPTQVSVTVSGTAFTFIPGFRFTVAESAHGTIERTTPVPP
jgi:hypothetical protein